MKTHKNLFLYFKKLVDRNGKLQGDRWVIFLEVKNLLIKNNKCKTFLIKLF